MKKLFYLSVLALVFSVMSCGGPEGERKATSSAKMSDSDLEKTIKSQLDKDESLKAADINVSANADKNEVTLSGTVKSEDQRAKAVELAKSTQPGITINDKIDVKPGEPRAG